MNGAAVTKMHALRPNFSTKVPPITPPSNAPRGNKLPIHDAFDLVLYIIFHSESCSFRLQLLSR